MNLKQLQEIRGAKAKEARTLLDTANTAKRALTEAELNTLNGLHSEVEGFDKQIHAEVRQMALESQKSTPLNQREERDIAGFDLAKVVNHLHRTARGSAVAAIDGVEAELLQEGDREARAAGIESGGVVLPRLLVRRNPERRDMTASGTTSTAGDQGGMTIATTKSGLLDDFFTASVLRQAGATILEGLTANVDFPRLTAGTTPTKKAENAAADEVSPLTAMLSLTPRRLPAFIDISERLLKQSGVALETIVRTHLTNQLLAVQEAAFFHGGGTNEPTGLAATSGIGPVAGGTNGAAPTFTHLVSLETAVDTSNALLGNLRYISNGQVRGKLKTTAKVSSTDSRMVLDSDGMLNGYSPLFTNAVSRTLDKGSATGVCSAIFFGNWSDFYVGYWSGVSLEMVRDTTNAKAGLYTLVANAYYDGGVVRPKSFAAMLDALAA